MSENKQVINLPTIKTKKSKKSRKINLPVKNWLMYYVKILSVDNIKPIHPKISGKKSTKIPLPIYLVDIKMVNKEKIDELKKSEPQEHLNYTNIDNFGKDKVCSWNVAPTHYEILKSWLLEKQVSIGQIFAFTRIGKGLSSKLIFLTENEIEKYMEKNNPEYKKDKETKTKK